MRSVSRPGRFRLGIHRVTFSAAVCAIAGGVASCGGEPDADHVAGMVRDSAGIQIVLNRGEGWGVDEAWRLEPDLQVGELDGPLSFGQVRWVAPGVAGGMLVLDGQSGRVHVFDSSGRQVAVFGGEGDGPGKFRNPAMVTRVRDGRIAVAVGFPPMLHWLTADGRYESSRRLPGSGDGWGGRTAGTFAAWQVTRTGEVYAQALVIDPSRAAEMPVHLYHLAADGTGGADTVTSWTWSPAHDDREMRMFEPVTTWMPRTDGSVFLSSGHPYELTERDSTGRVVRIVRRDVAPTATTVAHREAALRDIREEMRRGGAPESFIEERLSRIRFEATLPHVFRVWISEPDGRPWLGVYDPQGDSAAEARVNAWDVFETDGRYLGRVAAPSGFRLTVVTEAALYGVWENELEVSFARRYRVVRPGEQI